MKPLQTTPTPDAAPPKEEPTAGKGGLPAYDPKYRKYKILLKNGREWKVASYVLMKDRILIPVDTGNVELPHSDVKSITPIVP